MFFLATISVLSFIASIYAAPAKTDYEVPRWKPLDGSEWKVPPKWTCYFDHLPSGTLIGYPYEIQESDFEDDGHVIKGGIELTLIRDEGYAFFRVTLDNRDARLDYVLDPTQYPTSYHYIGTNAQNLPVCPSFHEGMSIHLHI